MDIDSLSSDETSPSDSDTSCSNESFEDEENDDTNNNEFVAVVEPVEKSNDESN